MSEKPEIDFPEGPPPSDLEIIDLTEGDGAEATPGATAVVHYVGVAYSTGEEFDASWNRGQSFAFPLGAGNVIAGWDRGVVGHEGRRSPPAGHPARARVRRPGCWRRHRPRRDADLRRRPARRALTHRMLITLA